MKLFNIKSKKLIAVSIDTLFFLVGSAIYSFSFCYFILPNKISPGGITGIAAVLNYVFSLPTGFMLLILNIPLIVWGFFKIGGMFIIKTGIVTVLTSILIDFLTSFIPVYHGDRLLAALYGGLLSGLGMALIMLRGATTGGIDIAAKILSSKYSFISMGRFILIMDFFVIALATVCYNDIETALYTIISIFTSVKVIDGVLYGADQGKLIYIVTKEGDNMADAIFKEVGRGITRMPVVGGYTRTERNMLMCAVRRHEVSKIHKIIKQTDPEAFVIVTEAGEILGLGFKAY